MEEGGPALALLARRPSSPVLPLSAGSARIPQRKVGEALAPDVFFPTSAA